MSEAAIDDFTVSGTPDEATEPTAAATAAAEAQLEADGSKNFVDRASEAIDDAKADDPDPASEAGKTLAKKRGDMLARINQLTRENKQSGDEAARLRAELATLKTPAKPAATPVADDAPITGPKPRLKTFTEQIGSKYESYDDAVEAHTDALTTWQIEEREAKRSQADRATADERAGREVAAQAQTRIDTFKQAHPDYDAVIGTVNIPGPTGPGTTSFAILRHLQHSDLGPALAYELAKDATELARIAGLAPGFAVAALGRLEAKIEMRAADAKSGPSAEARPVTTAKPPIKPVGSSPVTSDDGEVSDDLSFDEHKRRMDAREKAARRR